MTEKVLSPLDGRYDIIARRLSDTCSEQEVMRRKLEFEVRYFIFFSTAYRGAEYDEEQLYQLGCIYRKFDVLAYDEILAIERETQHDIKAIEIWLRNRLSKYDYTKDYVDCVHYGLTSQDTVSVGTYLAVCETIKYIDEKLVTLQSVIEKVSEKNGTVKFLARTHGQPAITTSVEYEMNRYKQYVEDGLSELGRFSRLHKISAKCGGAIGNLVALKLEYPDHNVEKDFDEFMFTAFTLYRSVATSQTDNWESLVKIMHVLEMICSSLINVCRDIWMYCSYGYIDMEVDSSYCGSSTMPQKVNPIKFEKAEGCFEKAEADFQFYCRKLSKSRLQRDLSDSVVIRSMYETYGWMLLGIESLTEGLQQISFNKEVCNGELENNYQILAEYVQLTLKKYNANGNDIYSIVKDKFRGLKSCTKKQYLEIIHSLEIEDQYVQDLLIIMTPADYYVKPRDYCTK